MGLDLLLGSKIQCFCGPGLQLCHGQAAPHRLSWGSSSLAWVVWQLSSSRRSLCSPFRGGESRDREGREGCPGRRRAERVCIYQLILHDEQIKPSRSPWSGIKSALGEELKRIHPPRAVSAARPGWCTLESQSVPPPVSSSSAFPHSCSPVLLKSHQLSTWRIQHLLSLSLSMFLFLPEFLSHEPPCFSEEGLFTHQTRFAPVFFLSFPIFTSPQSPAQPRVMGRGLVSNPGVSSLPSAPLLNLPNPCGFIPLLPPCAS